MNLDLKFALSPDHDAIALCDLLKLVGLAESGAAAKHLISEGRVRVEGQVETRKRCKIRKGQQVVTDTGTVTVE